MRRSSYGLRQRRGSRNREDHRKRKINEIDCIFFANQKYQSATNLLYDRFPKYFTKDKAKREWKPRKIYRVGGLASEDYDFSKPLTGVVGRAYNISSREGERYFLRTLFLHTTGATSFANLLVHESAQHYTFREACCALSLLSDDAEWMKFMQDAISSNFDSLTHVFSIMMAFCEP